MSTSRGEKFHGEDSSIGWAPVHTLIGLTILVALGLMILLSVVTSGYDQRATAGNTTNAEPPKHALRFAAATLNIRDGPSEEHSVVARFEPGDRVYTEPINRRWRPVFRSRTTDDTLGFVASNYLSLTPPESEPDSKSAPAGACLAAFRRAASISDMRDRVQDLDPAVRSCDSVDEWNEAARRNPDALDGVDPIAFLRNRCRFSGSSDLAATRLCQKVLR